MPSVKELEAKVNEQYDTDASMQFYTFIMGGGGDDIHYGIFNKGDEDLKTCSQNTIDYMCNLCEKYTAIGKGNGASFRVLDLGSGKGGASRHLASKYGCKVTCFNLGEKQNEYNLGQAKAAGIGELIECVLASFNEKFPLADDTFDMIWSQEAFCHAADHKHLMAEAKRVLKPGGAIIFSDLMGGTGAADTTSFTGTNACAEMATPQLYKDAAASAGLTMAEMNDLTPHLTPYFKLMLDVVKTQRAEMEKAGVAKDRLDAYETDLVTRFGKVENKEFYWGIAAVTKA
jgi:cyclopropane fatty-acyl-phospholipid synthase-like methyltransferase